MAKGTLLSNAKTIKRTGSASSVSGGSKKAAAGLSAAADTGAPAASKKQKTAAAARALKSIAKDGGGGLKAADDDVAGLTEVDKNGNQLRRLRVNEPKYSKYLRETLKENLDGADLLHAEGQDTVEKILKTFDLNADYGPAVGMTRMERWNRAAQWGLNPPTEVYDILTTVEGETQPKYRESLFYERF